MDLDDLARRGFMLTVRKTLGGLTLLFVAGALACSGDADLELPDGTPILLVSVDTLRSDRLPAYGHDRVETPNIDALARDAVLFDRAYSHCPLTLPSHATILTGLLPPEHGVRNNREARLRDDFTTIVETLADRGYRTTAFVSSLVLRASTGIAQGFERYDDGIDEGQAYGSIRSFGHRRGGETVDRAVEWLRENDLDSPWFLFVHLFDPHAPYDPPEPFRSRYEDRYDGEIAYVDEAVGHLLDTLREIGQYDRALIVFLSDHGEGLGDHVEQEHGIFLYRESVQVPLMFKLPGRLRAGTRVEDVVGLVDVAPTVLDLTGDATDSLPGRSLFRGPAIESRALYGETRFPEYQYGWSPLRSVIDGDLHYIEAPRPELYDLANDPDERVDLISSRDPRPSMLDVLETTGTGIETTSEMAQEELDRLASLGYVGGPSGPPTSGDRMDPKDGIEAAEDMWRQIRLAKETGASTAVDAAIERMRELRIRDPNLSRAIAGDLLRARRPEAALRFLEPLDGDASAETALHRGTAEFLLGNLERASRLFREALAERPDDPRIAYSLGASLEASGDDTGAISAYERALRSSPDDLLARTRLAETLRRSGRVEASLEEYAKVTGADPSSVRARFGEAIALARLGRWSESLDRFELAAAEFPDQPAFEHAVARILAACPDPAIRDVERALLILERLWEKDRSTGIAESVAMALAASGRFADAVTLEAQAIETASKAGREDEVFRMRPKLEAYRDGSPWLDPWPDRDPVHRPDRDAVPALLRTEPEGS